MYHKLIQQLAARASIIETFRKKRDSSSNTRREKRTLLPIYSSRPSYNCDKSVVSHLLRISLRVSFDNMRSVPLGKINIYNVYSMAVFSSSIFLSFFLRNILTYNISRYMLFINQSANIMKYDPFPSIKCPFFWCIHSSIWATQRFS